MNPVFEYDLAFSRNIGWFTEAEQQILKTKRVAIAGMGGVGANHALTLARLGITKFNLSDFDEYACENTNRQAGANINTYDRKKLDVMVEMLLAINPEIEIKQFPQGINEDNIHEFLDNVDCYVDSLDFFAVAARRMVFRECTNKAIPATTAAPIGMGTAYLNFLPGQMTFEEYFGLEGHTENEQYLKFFIGLTPAALQKAYLVDPSKLDLANKKGPSTIGGCMLASGVVAAQVAKIFLNRGDVLNVPWGLHFDAYTNQFKKTWRPGGHKNPLQKLAFNLGKKKFFTNPAVTEKASDAAELSLVEKILDNARWAPSGDNAQCWRFELIDELNFKIHAFDTSDHVVYDIDRHSSHLAHGALLATIEIAANHFGYEISTKLDDTNQDKLFISVTLIKSDKTFDNALFPYIKTRTVQRRNMGTRVLSNSERAALEAALPKGYTIQWLDSDTDKKACAKLNFTNAKTRLIMPEAFATHSTIIDWHKRYSKTKIPEQALGIDWLTGRMMQFLLKSWQRVHFANNFLAGTWLPRIQLDYFPSLKCTSHFVIKASKEASSIQDYINAGKAVQKFWLTATKLGFGFQPEQTPVIFSRYLRKDIHFTSDNATIENANKGTQLFEELVSEPETAVFMGRIGRSKLPASRSIRRDLSELIINK